MKHFSAEGADITPSKTPEDFGALIRTDVTKWAKVVSKKVGSKQSEQKVLGRALWS